MRKLLGLSALLVLIVQATLAGSIGAVPARALQPVVLQLRWDNQFQFAGYFAANWQGFYRDEGLEVEIRPALTADGKILSAPQEVATGRAQFGIGAADILMARDQGADLRVAATIFQQSAARFYLKETTSFTSLADLLHLRVARRVDDLIDVEFQAMLRSEGIDPDLVTPYPHQPGIDHLVTDQAQVIPGYNMTIPYYAAQADVALKEIAPASYGVDFYGDSIFTSGALIDRDPELAERFVRASLRGWEYALQHPEEVADGIATQFERIDRAEDVDAFNRFQIDAVRRLTLHPIIDLGHTNPYRWEKMNEMLLDLELVSHTLDVGSFIFDPQRVQALQEQRIRTYLLWGTAIALTALLLAVGWLFTLRRLVHQRTRALEDELYRREHAEAALRGSEEKYRLLVDNLSQGIWYIDEQAYTTFVNPAMASMLGYSVDEMIGRHLSDFMDEHGRIVAEQYLQARRDGVVERHDFGFLHKDGTQVHTSVQTGPILDERGRFIGAIAGIQDISELRQATEALQRSEANLHTLIEATDDIVVLRDREGRSVVFNSSYARLVRHLCGIEPTPGFCEMNHLIPSERARWADILAHVHAGNPFQLDYERIIAGEPRYFAMTLYPVYAGDKVIGSSEFTRDVTGRKQAEAERERLLAQLLQAQKMETVGRLAGGIAHDFNNMLAVIQLRSEMSLALVEAQSPLHRNLASIHDTAQRSTRLVRQLLGFARKQTIAPKVIDLNATIESLLPVLQRLIGEEIELNWRPASGLWSVRMDPSQVDQILTNLCVNARDAIDGVGTIVIETLNLAQQQFPVHGPHVPEPCDCVALRVCDSGCGIGSEELPYIFEPFYTTKAVGRGTGLGLATVDGIVQQNGGQIQVTSESGKGTTFDILLPRFTQDESPDQAQVGVLPLSGKGESILLVEDEAAVLQIGREALQSLGYHVVAATAPGDAIRQVEHGTRAIDLVVTDLIMPEMDGRALAAQITARQPGIKFLFISGYPSDYIVQRGVLEEGVHFLQKPYSLKEMAAKVRDALNGAPFAGTGSK